MGKALFGFMAGASPLLSFVQLVAARSLEKHGRPRRMMLTSGLLGRVLWVVGAVLPLVSHFWAALLPTAYLKPLFVLCILGSATAQACTGPSFFAWMTHLVPERVGPSFWARRQQIGTVVALLAVLVGGWCADKAGPINQHFHGHFPPLLTYSALLTLASLCGVMDIALFLGIKEPPSVRLVEEPAPLWSSLLAPLREPEVRGYLLFAAVATLGGAISAPLMWLFCLENLDMSKTQTGLMLSVLPLLGMAASYRFWGTAVKRYGSRPLLRFLTGAALPMSAIWFVVRPHSLPSLLALGTVTLVAGMLGAAYDTCNIQFLTRTCPQVPRPTLVALFALVTGTISAVASTTGGKAADWFTNWHADVLGMHLVDFHIVILLGLIPAAINALLVAPRLREPGATPTREAVKGTLRETRDSVREHAEGVKERAEIARDRVTSLYYAVGSRFTHFFQARGD